MKNFILLLFIGTNILSWANNEEDIIKSNISDVTVYMQGAQITQKASYTLKPGVTKLIVDNISPSIDRNSLQVNASGNCVVIDAKYSLFYPKPEETNLEGLPMSVRKDIQLLEDSLQHIGFDLQGIQDEIDLYISTKNILQQNGAIRGQGKVNDSIQLLKQAVDYYLLKVNELNKKILSLNQSKAEKQSVQKRMQSRLHKLKNYQNDAKLSPKPKGPSHRIIVTLSAKEAVSGKLMISYLVSNAGWVPLYDLRADAGKENINMNFKARVFQNTGIDWDDIKLSISTNNPYQNKTKPELHPWYLNYNNYQIKQQTVSTKTLEMKKKELNYEREEASEKMDMDASAPVTNSTGFVYNAQSSANFTQVLEHMISAEFKIDLPYNIPSDGEHHMVLVQNFNVPTKYKHYSIPKLDPSVYLIAEIYNLTDYQLIPSQANIFFDGTYMGETYIKPNQMEDTITLSLGVDPNVLVKRTLLKKECKDKTIGQQKERTMAYLFEVKNIKSTNVDLVIFDQIPVTTNTDIEITAEELSKGKLEEKTGTVEWNYKLKAKENKEFEFKYRVKHNKDLVLYL